MSEAGPARLHLRIITPGLVLAEAEVDSVSIPTTDGLIGVYPRHRPLLVWLGEGEVSYRQGERGESFRVRGGYAEIHPERVLVFTESAAD